MNSTDPYRARLDPIPWQDGLLATFAVVVPSAFAWALGGWAPGALDWVGLAGLVGATAIAVALFLRHRESLRWDAYAEKREPGRTRRRQRRHWRQNWPAFVGAVFLFTLVVSILNPAFKQTVNEAGRPILVAIDHIPWLPTTTSPQRSQDAVLFIVGWSAFCILLQVWRLHPRAVALIRFGLLFNTLVLAVAGIFFHLLGTDLILGKFEPSADYFFATFYYKNHWAALAILGLGLALGFLFNPRPQIPLVSAALERSGKPFFAVAAAILALSIALSDSRSGVLLLGVVIVASMLYIARQMPGARRWALPLVAILGVGLAALAFPELQKRWEDTEGQIERADSLVEVDRIRMVDGPRITTEMALDRPYWGWGLHTYYHVFPQYATAAFYNPRTGELQSVLEFAHNDWLQTWAECGTIGLGLVLIWIFGQVITVRKTVMRSIEGRWIALSLILLSMLALWDFPFRNPAVFAHTLVLFLTLGASGWKPRTAR